MRQKNIRVAATGAGLIVLAAGFFIGMLGATPKSTDPAAMMQTVGTVSGVGCGLGIVMLIFGLIGRRQT